MSIPDDIVAWRGDTYKISLDSKIHNDKPDSSNAGVKVQLSDGTQKWMSYIEYEEYRASNNK